MGEEEQVWVYLYRGVKHLQAGLGKRDSMAELSATTAAMHGGSAHQQFWKGESGCGGSYGKVSKSGMGAAGGIRLPSKR